MNWKKTLAAIVLSSSLAVAASALPAFADQSGTAAAKPASVYALADHVTAEIKGVLNDKVSEGTRLGAVVRLQNTGARVTRVPDYELRLTTADGVTYTLQPSAANARSIQPKAKAELAYLLTVDRTDAVQLKTLSFIHVNDYVYPRQETALLSVDISEVSDQAQGGTGSTEDVKKWGESFALAFFSPNLAYTPVDLTRQSAAQGPLDVITLRAKNSGQTKQYVPDFVISGMGDDGQMYNGSRVEQDAVALQPGEAKNLHFAIPLDDGVALKSLAVMTPESFVPAGAAGQAGSVAFNIGSVSILLPGQGAPLGQMPVYAYDTPIAFDPLNQLVASDVMVSLVELHMHANGDDGYKTVVAKFKLKNTGGLPAAVPAFAAELRSADGFSYSGVRQNLTTADLMPNLSYVVNYSFNVPISEAGDAFELKLLDNQTTAPYSSTIAAIKVQPQEESRDGAMQLYPFTVKLNDWHLNAYSTTVPVTSYSYKLKVDLSIQHQDNVVVDANFSKLDIELTDALGRAIGSKMLPLVGDNKLVSGVQIINFDNISTDQQEFPLTINIYEAVDTPNGLAKRLIRTLQQ